MRGKPGGGVCGVALWEEARVLLAGVALCVELRLEAFTLRLELFGFGFVLVLVFFTISLFKGKISQNHYSMKERSNPE